MEALDSYLARYARQNHQSGLAKTFVATPPDDPGRVLGYYSIAPSEVERESAPRDALRGSGQYRLPVFRIGRLAVDASMQGQGLGADLLAAAGARALSVADSVGGVALAIDAKDERAAAWYERLGGVRLLDAPLSLIIPIEVFARGL